MLFKAVVLEVLAATAAVVSAQDTTAAPVEVAINAKHTPLSQCPGRSRVYMALSKYSAPASFCSSYLSLNGGTKTVTISQPNKAVKTTTTATVDSITTLTTTTTTTVTTTTISGILAQCTAGGPGSPSKRDVSVDSQAKASASASASAKASASASSKPKVPAALRKFRPKALTSACHCLGYNKAGSGATVTVTASASTASESVKTKLITSKATTTYISTYTSTVTTTVASQVAGIDGAKFAIMASDSGTTYDGIYLALTGETINRAGFSAPTLVNASDFQINENNQLIEFDNKTAALTFANQDLGSSCEPVYFDPSLSSSMVALTCCVDADMDLQCGNVNGASEFSVGSQNGLLYFCQANKTADFGGLAPVKMSVQLF